MPATSKAAPVASKPKPSIASKKLSLATSTSMGDGSSPDIIAVKSRQLFSQSQEKAGAVSKKQPAASKRANPKDREPASERTDGDEFDLSNLPSTGRPVSKRNNQPIVKSPLRPKPIAPLAPTVVAMPTTAEKRAIAPKLVAKLPDNFDDAYVDLQGRFEKLSALQEREAERLFAEYKRAAQSRLDASDKLIASLRLENERLKKQGVPSAPRLSLAGSEVSDASAVGKDHALDLFEELTGLRLAPTGEENTWRAYAFELSFDPVDTQYTYRPVKTLPQLPSYLKEEIVFERDQAQAFFWRVLDFLMSSK